MEQDNLLAAGIRPLQGSMEIPGYPGKIQILSVVGRGASCLCYAVECMETETEIPHRMILKEFCPAILDAGQIKRDGIAMTFRLSSAAQQEELQELYEGIEAAYLRQSRLANEAETMGIVVRPAFLYRNRKTWRDGRQEYTFLAFYEANWGDSLEKLELSELHEILMVAQKTADALSRLHRQGILHMDIKPENILLVDRGTESAAVKLFDFDASIPMKQKKNAVIRHSNPMLLAPELLFDNKILYLSEKVDSYALGAMLFHKLLGRYPTANDTRQSIGMELQRCFQYQYRKQLTGKQQELLCTILYHSCSRKISTRYRPETLAAQLKKLLNSMQGDRFEPDDVGQVSYSMLSAGILERHPLYVYRTMDAPGHYRMEAVIVGSSPMRDAFLEQILSCCQMLDTALHLHLPNYGGRGYVQDLLARCPSLGKVVRMDIDGVEYTEENGDKRQYFPEDQSIVTERLAHLHIYSMGDRPVSIAVLKQLLGEAWQRIGYFLFTDADPEVNYRLAGELASERNGESVFVGYCDDRGDGYDLRTQLPDPAQCIDHEPIGMDANTSMQENCFHTAVTARALEIHRHYTHGTSDTEAQIRQKFMEDSAYHKRSSIRRALAMPYQVLSAGIDPRQEDAGECFRRRVLSGSEEANRMLNRLLWLEHRSWCAFMVMNGAQCPAMEELYAYAFQNGNDQKNLGEKLHPCLCESRDQGLELQKLTADQWLHCDVQGFDSLDRLSLLLHRYCYERTKQVRIDDYLALLRRKTQKLHCENLIRQLEQQFQLMREGKPHTWEQTCDALEARLAGNMIPEHLLTCIREEARVVVEYSRIHDYKASDLDMIQAIPQLLSGQMAER